MSQGYIQDENKQRFTLSGPVAENVRFAALTNHETNTASAKKQAFTNESRLPNIKVQVIYHELCSFSAWTTWTL